MPRGTWSAKRERQYEHIKKTCLKKRGKKSSKLCERIAAATVNKARASAGETKAARRALGCPCQRR